MLFDYFINKKKKMNVITMDFIITTTMTKKVINLKHINDKKKIIQTMEIKNKKLKNLIKQTKANMNFTIIKMKKVNHHNDG